MGATGFFLTLEDVASVIEKYGDDDAILSSILKELDPDPEIAFLINLESMCERYSCLPKDLLEEDAYYLRVFQAILRGKMKGMESKVSKSSLIPNFTNKQIKKTLR